jgi:hypothetical protein
MAAVTLEYLDPVSVRAWVPEGGSHLRVELADRQVVLSARVKRIFPLSSEGRYLSLQDGANREIGILRSMEGLDVETRRLFEQELDRRYFSPKILRIDVLRLEASMWRFVVETHRGPAEFYVRNWRDSAHEIGNGRWQITSVDGQRFEIPQAGQLDERSQLLLEQLF